MPASPIPCRAMPRGVQELEKERGQRWAAVLHGEGESFHGDKKSKSWVSCFKAEMRTLPKREQLVGITRDDGATPAALCN